jgi:hypothetical protein
VGDIELSHGQTLGELLSKAIDEFGHIDVTHMDAGSAAEVAFASEHMANELTAEFERLIRPLRHVADAAVNRVRSEITKNGGKALPHDYLDIHIEQRTEREKRIDGLRRLKDLVPERDLKDAVYLTNPAPEWKADLRKLDSLARKYGGEVAEVIKANTPVVSLGPPRLIIKALTKEGQLNG